MKICPKCHVVHLEYQPMTDEYACPRCHSMFEFLNNQWLFSGYREANRNLVSETEERIRL